METETTKRRRTTSCGSVVYKVVDGKVCFLLVRPFRDRDSWGVPKGHINENEDPRACARRETLEEAGISVDLGDELPTVTTRFRDEHKTVVTFLAKQVCDAVPRPLDGENVDVRWFTEDGLPTLHVYQRPLIANALKKIKESTGGDSE